MIKVKLRFVRVIPKIIVLNQDVWPMSSFFLLWSTICYRSVRLNLPNPDLTLIPKFVYELLQRSMQPHFSKLGLTLGKWKLVLIYYFGPMYPKNCYFGAMSKDQHISRTSGFLMTQMLLPQLVFIYFFFLSAVC